MKITNTVNIGFDVNMDISFIREMISGGVSDDGSALIGDISYTDTSTYSSTTLTENEKRELYKKFDIE
jgi:hypothetical protein